MKNNIIAWSEWQVEHRRADGSLITKTVDLNTVTNEGLNDMLNVLFHGGTQKTTWYILLYGTNTTPSGSTTYATPVFTEITANYDEATRQEFVEAAASGQQITNSANKARFTFNTNQNVYGGALVGGGSSASTKGNTAGGGVMFAAALFSSMKSMSPAEYLDISVTITGASA